MPGSLPSAAAPLVVELARCGLGGALAMRGGSLSIELRCFFVGESGCAGEGKELGEVESILVAPWTDRGEGSSASDQLRLDILPQERSLELFETKS
jgi:hypothetical protein